MRCLLALPLAASVLAADLFKDDFSKLPAGHLSQPVGQWGGAIQEYHYLEHRGVPTAPWENAIDQMNLMGDERDETKVPCWVDVK